MKENMSKHNIKVICNNPPKSSQGFPKDFPSLECQPLGISQGSRAALLVLGRCVHGDFIRNRTCGALAAVLRCPWGPDGVSADSLEMLPPCPRAEYADEPKLGEKKNRPWPNTDELNFEEFSFMPNWVETTATEISSTCDL